MTQGEKLTEAQKRFCDEYLIDLNATRAYKAVYKICKTDETAAASAARLLKKDKVMRYIDKRMTERSERTEVTQDRVIRELASIAFADLSDFVKIDPTGRVVITQTAELTPAQRRAVSMIKETRDGVEVRLYDKQRALELLGKHMGMFRDRIEIAPSVSDAARKIAEILEEGGDDEPGASS